MHRGRSLKEFCGKCGGVCFYTSSGLRRRPVTIKKAEEQLLKNK